MADLKTSILDWNTGSGATDNVPNDATAINGNGTSQYNGIANYFRDVKAAIREDSLNLGFDPSTTFRNVSSSKVEKDSGDDSRRVMFFVHGNLEALRITEGQMFFISVYDSVSTPKKWVYYSGYVVALQEVTSNSKWRIYPSGLVRWAESPANSDASGLSQQTVDQFESGDWGRLGTSGDNSGAGYNSISFSAYAPRSGLSYITGASSDNITNKVSITSAPIHYQSGVFYADNTTDTYAVTLPVKQPDSSYTVNLTPTDNSGTINKDAFKVESISTSRSLFRVVFKEKPDSGVRIEWNWKTSRGY